MARWPARKSGHLTIMSVRPNDVAEGVQGLCLALEPRNPLGIGRERFGQDLDRHVAIELPIAGAIHFAHAAAADARHDLIRAECAPWRHGFLNRTIQYCTSGSSSDDFRSTRRRDQEALAISRDLVRKQDRAASPHCAVCSLHGVPALDRPWARHDTLVELDRNAGVRDGANHFFEPASQFTTTFKRA